MRMVTKRVTRLIADMAEGQRESLTVAALRDMLPPKLISAALRVEDAERSAAAVGV